MSLTPTTLKLPDDLLHVLDVMARDADITTGQLVRSILSKEISRRKNARPPIRADEPLIAPLRARLAPILGTAPDWTSIQAKLKEQGYELRQAGGGLALHSYPDGERLCKASELGFSYSKLIARLSKPFPGHTHFHVFDRVMRKKADSDLDDFDVVETTHRTTFPSGQLI